MMKRFAVAWISPLVFLLFMTCFTPAALSLNPGNLQEGIRQYNADNYEEALELFKRAREQSPLAQAHSPAQQLGLSNNQQNRKGIQLLPSDYRREP